MDDETLKQNQMNMSKFADVSLKSGPPPIRLVVIESPYGGDVEKNVRYLNDCLRDSLLRNEAPYASHGLYVGALDDNDPKSRVLGMQAGFAWGDRAAATVVYYDLGVSRGMREGISRSAARGRPIEWRSLEDWASEGRKERK